MATSISIQALHIGKTVTFNTEDIKLEFTYTPEWSSEPAYGKMDGIATYARTTRQLAAEFQIGGQNLKEYVLMQYKVQELIQFNYPSYIAGGRAIQAPPFFKLSVLNGGYFQPVEGYINSLIVTPGHSAGIIPAGANGKYYERQYNISFTFTVLHTSIPGWLDGAFSNTDGHFSQQGVDGGSPSERATARETIKHIKDAGNAVSAINKAVNLGIVDPSSTYDPSDLGI